jgi:hypothetical protein
MCGQDPALISHFDLGYAMGLVVGEGSFTGDRASPALSVKMHKLDPEPLRFLVGRSVAASTARISTPEGTTTSTSLGAWS